MRKIYLFDADNGGLLGVGESTTPDRVSVRVSDGKNEVEISLGRESFGSCVRCPMTSTGPSCQSATRANRKRARKSRKKYRFNRVALGGRTPPWPVSVSHHKATSLR